MRNSICYRLSGRQSQKFVQQSLTVIHNLNHRGATIRAARECDRYLIGTTELSRPLSVVKRYDKTATSAKELITCKRLVSA